MVEISPSLPGQLRETLLPMFQSICLLSYDKKKKQRKLVVNDPARGICDRFHSFGDVKEVDITDDPRFGIEGLIKGALGAEVKESPKETVEEVKEQVSVPVEDNHGEPVPVPETHDGNGDPKVKKARRAKRVIY